MFLNTKENLNLQRNGVEFLRAIITSKLSLYPQITKKFFAFSNFLISDAKMENLF